MKLSFTRRDGARLVLLAWAIALAWLARRELWEGSGSLDRTVARVPPGGHFFSVAIGTTQLGIASITFDTLPDGVRLTELLTMDLPNADSTRRTALVTDATLTRGLSLRAFTTTFSNATGSDRIEGHIDGDTVLYLRQVVADTAHALRDQRALKDRLNLASMIPLRIAFGGFLHVGRTARVTTIDPLGLGQAETEVRVTAESTLVVPDSAVYDTVAKTWRPARSDTLPAWRLDYSLKGLSQSVWIDDRGMILQMENALGVTLRRSAFEIVSGNYRATRNSHLPEIRRLAGARSLVMSGFTPDTSASGVAFKLDRIGKPLSASLLLALNGGRQRTHGDTVQILREGAVLPRNSAQAPRPYLATPGNIMDPGANVASTAQDLVRNAPSARDSVGVIARWVATEIARDASEFGATAPLEVFQARHAGPAGHAHLFVAMARSVGIPSRVVSGLALVQGEALAHVWAEVWIGGWFAVDPTFGHSPASASLLRFLEGGLGRSLDILKLAGALQFQPLPHPGP